MVPSDPVAKFIARRSHAEAAERANYVPFLTELCDLLAVPRPDPAGPAKLFARAKEKEVAEILETLAALGRTHPGDSKGTYVR